MHRPHQKPRLLPGAALALCLAVALLVCAGRPAAAAEKKPQAYLIRLDGAINDALTEAIKRKIQETVRQEAPLIILELNTPGGTVKASMELAEFIHGDVDTQVIAYINTMAYSGGTMVALACDEIYIDESKGAMGDVAPITGGGQEVGEKFQAPIRELMRKYAAARGYPEALVEAMVSKQVQVWRIHKTDDPEGTYHYVRDIDLNAMPEKELARVDEKKIVVPQGELLTMSSEPAVEYGFARKAVSSRLDLYDTLKLDPGGVERLYLSTSEKVLAVLDSFSFLLIIGGLILLFIELNNPGFGLPGILGLIMLATFFIVKYSLHYANMLEIILFFIGVVLLMVELFVIPGFGVAGISGLVLIFVSLLLMLQQFTLPGTPSETEAFQFNLLQVLGTFVATAVGLLLLARYMESIPLLNRLIQHHTMEAANIVGEPRQGEKGLGEMVGEVGVALTPLRPSGRAQFGEMLLDVVAEGELIEQGKPVEIVAVRGRRVTVRPHETA